MADAFKAVMAIRDHILTEGTDFDLDAVKEALDTFNLLDEEMIELLGDSRLQQFEKYHIAKSKVIYGNILLFSVVFIYFHSAQAQYSPKLSRN